MNQHQIPIIFVVENHWLLGKIRLERDQRALDVLNDSMSKYVTLEEASVYSAFDSVKSQAVLPQVALLKDHLRLAISPTDKFEIPRKNRMHRIVEKYSKKGSAIASGYLVQGTFHLNHATSDPTRILSDCLGRYFPMTAANVFGPSKEPFGAAAVLINRDFISSVAFDAETPQSDARAIKGQTLNLQQPSRETVGLSLSANVS